MPTPLTVVALCACFASQESFRALPVSPVTSAALRQLPSGADEAKSVRINLRKRSRGVIHFVNNLEKDDLYQSYVVVVGRGRGVVGCG